jgi:ADP-ribose pyrophosphatase YjhB (NUDIX family)
MPADARPLAIRPGVSAVILTERGVLLQQRDDNRLWGLPGGAVEPGESVAEALVREVREETGLEVEPLRVIGVYSAPENHQIVTYPDGNVIHYVSTAFECRIVGGTLVCGEESLALEWFDPERLPPDLLPMSRIRIRDALARELRAFFR